MPQTQVVQIQCPNCGTPYQAPVRSVIDVGQDPKLRQAFLAGQVNVAVCPKCRVGGMLDLPIVYHDPAVEFLAVYFPPQLNVPELERQKIIGELTQELMRALPPEQRKGYFLNPRQFLNRQGLLDAILGTMGVSQEELDRQRKKLKLIDQFRVMADDRKGLEMMIKVQDSQIDYEFFVLLSGILEQAVAAGDEKTVQQLQTLRQNLMELTTWGKKAARQQAAVESLGQVKTAEEFLEKLIAADPDEVEAIAIAARPALDYGFFQRLSERMEASRGAEHDRLSQLRDRLLTITQQMDAATRAAVQNAAGLLQEILSAPDSRSAVREHAEEIDDTFMAVLSSNLREAGRRGSKHARDRLQAILDEILALADEAAPPEVRLINQLMRTDYPDGTRALLKERQAELTPEMLELIDKIADQLAEREDTETAKRLRDIKAQALLLV